MKDREDLVSDVGENGERIGQETKTLVKQKVLSMELVGFLKVKG